MNDLQRIQKKYNAKLAELDRLIAENNAKHAQQIRHDAAKHYDETMSQARRDALKITAAATAATEEQRRKLNRDTEALRDIARAKL